MDIQQDENTEYTWKTKAWWFTYPHENSQEKKKRRTYPKNHFSKDNFNLRLRNDDLHMSTWPTTIQKKRIPIQKQNIESHIGTKECKNCPVQEYCSKTQRYMNNQRLRKHLQNKNAKKKMGNLQKHKKSTKHDQKQQKYHLPTWNKTCI